LLRRRGGDGVGLPVDGFARYRRAIRLLVAAAKRPPTLCRGNLRNDDERQRGGRQGKHKTANDISD